MPGKESSVFGDDGGGDTWMQPGTESELDVVNQSAGMTPLDDKMLEEELAIRAIREQRQSDQI